MQKTSFSCYFKGFHAFISHIDQRCSINCILLDTRIVDLYRAKLILIYRVGNKYIGCNMQITSFSCYLRSIQLNL